MNKFDICTNLSFVFVNFGTVPLVFASMLWLYITVNVAKADCKMTISYQLAVRSDGF